MSVNKRMIVSLTAVLALAAVWYAVTKKPPEINERTEIAEFEAEDISSIDLHLSDRSYSLINSAGKWRLSNTDDEPDSLAVEGFLNEILHISGKEVKQREQDKAVYGLDKPLSQVTYNLTDGKTLTLYLGALTAAETEYYLLDENDNLYTVYTAAGKAMLTNDYSLRELLMCNIPYEQLREVRIEKDGIVSFMRNADDTWSVNRNGAADGVISGETFRHDISRNFSGMYARKTFEATAENKEKFGLGENAAQVTVISADGDVSFTVGASDSGGTYVMRGDCEEIYMTINDYFEFILKYQQE